MSQIQLFRIKARIILFNLFTGFSDLGSEERGGGGGAKKKKRLDIFRFFFCFKAFF